MSSHAQGFAGATLSAKVFRINWEKRPRLVPKSMWLWMGKKRFPFTGKWENLGVIASQDEGTLEIK